MARLPRPHIPLKIRCHVAAHQIGWGLGAKDGQPAAIAMLLSLHKANYGNLLLRLLTELQEKLGVLPSGALHLDHDPALVNRKKIKRDGKIVGYKPAANDPNFLIYRTKERHDIKTRVRGDGAQFSDLALARRERRRQKKRMRPKRKWPSRPFQTGR